mgnify:CR=1 FL=1
MTNNNEKQWLQTLQSFLNVLLTPVIKDKTKRFKYLEPNAMKIWARAFTHETVSPSDNYEDLEFAGDAVLKWAFPKYLRKRFPYLHKGEYTELNVAYMSKIMQAQLARNMGLGEHIRVTGMDRAILNLETDVFESFFGALEEVADSILDGLGAIQCYNMIVHLFQNIDIDESKARGSAKTQVIQMFVRFDLSKPQEQSPGSEISITASPEMCQLLNLDRSYLTKPIAHAIATKDKDAEYEAYKQFVSFLSDLKFITISEERISNQDRQGIDFSVSLRKEHIDFLHSYGVDIANPVIGYAIAPTKKEAQFEAYSQALKTLESYGITTEWAEEAKQIRDFSDPYVAQYTKAASERLARDGFRSMYFFIPRKTVTQKGAIVQLVGTRPNGADEVLSYTYSTDRENSYRNAKTLVVQQYATNYKS